MLIAKSSEHGLEILTNDSELFQRRFHAARVAARKSGDTSFDTLRCRIISSKVIYLINKEHPDGKDRTREDNYQIIPR
jgi:hypothetical protein